MLIVVMAMVAVVMLLLAARASDDDAERWPAEVRRGATLKLRRAKSRTWKGADALEYVRDASLMSRNPRGADEARRAGAILAPDIERSGLRDPIRVAAVDTEWYVIDGHSRLEALHSMHGDTMPDLKVLVVECTQDEYEYLLYASNAGRVARSRVAAERAYIRELASGGVGARAKRSLIESHLAEMMEVLGLPSKHREAIESAERPVEAALPKLNNHYQVWSICARAGQRVTDAYLAYRAGSTDGERISPAELKRMVKDCKDIVEQPEALWTEATHDAVAQACHRTAHPSTRDGSGPTMISAGDMDAAIASTSDCPILWAILIHLRHGRPLRELAPVREYLPEQVPDELQAFCRAAYALHSADTDTDTDTGTSTSTDTDTSTNG